MPARSLFFILAIMRYGHELADSFEYEGIWCLPDKPNELFLGILKFTPDKGPYLELFGHSDDIEHAFDQEREQEIILGTAGGTDITLCDCSKLGSKFSSGTMPRSAISFRCSYVLTNVHFQKTTDISFETLYLSFSNLNEWFNRSALSIEHPTKDLDILKSTQPAPLEVFKSGEFNLSIHVFTPMPYTIWGQEDITIKQNTFFKLEFSTPKDLEYLFTIMFDIQNFLTLAISKPVRLRSLHCLNRKTESASALPSEIFFWPREMPHTEESILPHSMLFSFDDIKDRHHAVFDNWFNNTNLLRPVLDSYFGTIYAPHMYLEHDFLSLIQAIESFHRRTHVNVELQQQDHSDRIGSILETTPREHKNWLHQKLQFANEPSLRARLKELLDEFANILQYDSKQKKSFINIVTNTRNYFIHYDESLKEQAAEDEQLLEIRERLRMLLEMCLLKMLGFTVDEIQKQINRRYSRLV